MPVTPLGFCPPELSPRAKPGTPSQGPMPSCRWPPRTARLQGLRPGADPLLRRTIFQASPQPAALLGFHPLQGLPRSRDGTPTGPSSLGLVRDRLSVPLAGDLQSLAPRESWLDSLESADPHGVSRLIVLPTHPNDFPPAAPHTPPNRIEMSKCALLELPVDRASGPSNVSATNPSDSHRPSQHHIKPVGGVKHFFRRNLPSYYNSRRDARKFHEKNSCQFCGGRAPPLS